MVKCCYRAAWFLVFAFCMLLLGTQQCVFAQELESNADELRNFVKQFLGRDSCAANTCHGGPVGDSITWNSSLTVFEAVDPHARAGIVLRSELSEAMIELLEPGSKKSDGAVERNPAQVAIFEDVMKQRCAPCHAPALAVIDAKAVSRDRDAAIVDGVSCESCHGAAGEWMAPHLQADFDVAASPYGMRNTTNFESRMNGCVRCHVGSRREDGMVRDMNHDMIAAGHPPLRFDGWAYSEQIPRHWDIGLNKDDGISQGSEDDNARRFRVAKLVAFRAALELTQERVVDSARPDAVWPELADFDCFACHQKLRIQDSELEPSRIAALKKSLGSPRYNPWLASGIDEQWNQAGGRDETASQDYYELIQALSTERNNLRVISSSKKLSATVDGLISKELNSSGTTGNADAFVPFRADVPNAFMVQENEVVRALDWHDAAVWFLQTQAVLADHVDTEGSLKNDFRKLFDQLRFSDVKVTSDPVGAGSPADFDIRAFRVKADQFLEQAKAANSTK